ncbi:hypothetical protein Bpfe_001418, partial [Biomphalaria pfeifferi]
SDRYVTILFLIYMTWSPLMFVTWSRLTLRLCRLREKNVLSLVFKKYNALLEDRCFNYRLTRWMTLTMSNSSSECVASKW